MIDADKIKNFQQKILDYYEQHGRDLPWRHTTDPYHILVSEIMLQQTQVDRVISYYHRWLDVLPTIQDLAEVDKKTLLSLWSGLGYNNRALRLQKLAQEVVEKYDGVLPHDQETLLSLPGIGPYTSCSVLAFAFNKEVPVVDTNIRRILIHEFELNEKISVKELEAISLTCIPKGKSCIWFNALMDYGATHLTARRTGIKPVSKQSKFQGSVREVRGFVTKYLTDADVLDLEILRERFDDQRIDAALSALEKDDMILRDGDLVKLKL